LRAFVNGRGLAHGRDNLTRTPVFTKISSETVNRYRLDDFRDHLGQALTVTPRPCRAICSSSHRSNQTAGERAAASHDLLISELADDLWVLFGVGSSCIPPLRRL
jgi:hypothetical protein